MATAARKGDVKSIFSRYQNKSYPHQYEGTIHVTNIFGGVPRDPKVAEAWLRTKVTGSDELIRDAVAQIMLEQGVTKDEATSIVDINKHLNGFKRKPVTGELYIESRQLKACLKEACSIAANVKKVPARGWGETNKGLHSWFPEHVFVKEDQLGLGVKEPDGANQDFVHTFRGTGIQYNEYVDECDIHFPIEADFELSPAIWAGIWTTAERNGIGASRSQGRGRFVVTKWDKVK